MRTHTALQTVIPLLCFWTARTTKAHLCQTWTAPSSLKTQAQMMLTHWQSITSFLLSLSMSSCCSGLLPAMSMASVLLLRYAELKLHISNTSQLFLSAPFTLLQHTVPCRSQAAKQCSLHASHTSQYSLAVQVCCAALQRSFALQHAVALLVLCLVLPQHMVLTSLAGYDSTGCPGTCSCTNTAGSAVCSSFGEWPCDAAASPVGCCKAAEDLPPRHVFCRHLASGETRSCSVPLLVANS